MRNYEVVFIVHPDLEESAFNDIVDRVKGWITSSDGIISKVDIWGKRKLAYPLRKQREGQYVLMQAEMPPALCAELERNLRLTEPVLRHLIILEDN
jgi:small subunit ribosomal protein S6